ncbi:DUF742 domain-containing protein [Streptomyces polyrhachis]|uniref:DUF742 domain-containing protein n=1 Tax=Streptomyces polyrhachis TaxID=1282885 RepID=A0ABW2GJT6_9ACTN
MARTAPADGAWDREPITMHSIVSTVADPRATGAIPAEWQEILSMCAGPGLAVAEVAARIHLRLTPTVELLRQLLTHGLIEHSAPLNDAEAASVEFLRRLRRGLARG